MSFDLNRRELFKALTGGALAATLQLPAAEPNAPLFFSKDEFALLNTLTEIIIPTDNHSPGAREAGVAAYIDRRVAEAFLAKEKDEWRDGLAAINTVSQQMFQGSFDKITPQQQADVLAKLVKNERNPQTEPEKFFAQLKQTTAFAYYSSRIGIHQEIEYKGNIILDKFVGFDAS